MGHRAALYTVEVRPRGEPQKQLLLGDLDGHGSWLADLLDGYLSDAEIAEDQRKLKCLSSEINGADLLLMFEHGVGGIDAVIRRKDGSAKAHQETDDSQDVECGCLFRLTPNQRIGWLAVHSPNGRGIKTMLDGYVREKFRANQPRLLLAVTPYVPESALRRAIDQNLIHEIKLVKRVQPSDRSIYGIDQWIGEQYFGKIEVVIGAKLKGQARRLLSQPLQRFLDNADGSRDAIVQFQGMTFDEAKILVQQGDTVRTFNIEHPSAGHPLTEQMDLGPGKPTPEMIFEALRSALGNVST